MRGRLQEIAERTSAAGERLAAGHGDEGAQERWNRMRRETAALERQIDAQRSAMSRIRQRIREMEARPEGQSTRERLPGAAIAEVYDGSGDGPKPAWLEMTKITMICTRERVFRLDHDRIRGELEAAIEKATGSSIAELTAASWPTVVSYVSEHDVGDPFIRLKLSRSGSVSYVFREGAIGDDVTSLTAGESRFERLLRTKSPDAAWVRFLVWEDSFDAYAIAREIAEKRGYRVGWLPFASDQELIVGGGGGVVDGPDSAGSG